MKKLAIVTVCLNAEKHIDQTIRSIVSQKADQVEYIVVDGVSTDNTVNIINSHRELIDVFVSEPDSGIYDAMNKGVQLANSKYIFLVNADDFLESGVVARILTAIDNNPDVDIFHGSMNLVDEAGGIKRAVHPPGGLFSELRSTPYKHPTCVVSKSWYSKIGGYDTIFETAADYDFMLRSISHNAKVFYLDMIMTNLRAVGITSGTSIVTNPEEIVECLYRYTNSKLVAFIFVFMRKVRKCF